MKLCLLVDGLSVDSDGDIHGEPEVIDLSVVEDTHQYGFDARGLFHLASPDTLGATGHGSVK